MLPVVIHNAIDVQPKGQFAYRRGQVEVEVLSPVDTSEWTKATLDQHIAEVRNMFLETLGYPPESVPVPKKSEEKKAKTRKKISSRKKNIKKKTTKKSAKTLDNITNA